MASSQYIVAFDQDWDNLDADNVERVFGQLAVASDNTTQTNAAKRLQGSLWALRTTYPPGEIVTQLMNEAGMQLDEEHTILIHELDLDMAHFVPAEGEAWEWLMSADVQ